MLFCSLIRTFTTVSFRYSRSLKKKYSSKLDIILLAYSYLYDGVV